MELSTALGLLVSPVNSRAACAQCGGARACLGFRPRYDEQWTLPAHGRPCSLKMAKRHVAGTPCVPWSKRGINLGLKDVNTLYLLGLRLQLQEPDLIEERLCQNEAATVFHCEELQLPDEPNVFI